MSQMHVDALKYVRHQVAMSKYSIYICTALQYEVQTKEARQIRRWIEESMGHQDLWDIRDRGVGGWLHVIVGIPKEELTSEAMREYRLRWIDQMIPIVATWR